MTVSSVGTGAAEKPGRRARPPSSGRRAIPAVHRAGGSRRSAGPPHGGSRTVRKLATVRRMDWPRVARAADAVVVAALAVSGQVSVWTADSGALAEDRPVHALLLAVATVPLFVRRSRPLLVLLLVLGASWVQFELGGRGVPAVVRRRAGALRRGRARRAAGGRRRRAASRRSPCSSGDVPKLLAGDPVDEVRARLVRPGRHLGPRPLDPVAAAGDRGPGRARRAGRAGPRRARRAGGRRRARPHRPRAARPGRAQHGRDRHPVAGRPAGASTPSPTPPARRSPSIENAGPAGPGRDAPAARPARPARRTARSTPAAEPARAGRPGRPGARGRRAGRAAGRRRPRRRCPPGVDLAAYRIVAGGADQRAQARRPGDGAGARAARRRSARRRGLRRRPRRRRRRPAAGARPGRHARARRPLRRRRGGRATCPAAGTGCAPGSRWTASPA